MFYSMTPFGVYCSAVSVAAILLNILFLVVTKLKRVEGFQEVLVFMRNIAVGYILLSLCIIALAPQCVINGQSAIFLPHGLAATLDSVVLHGLASFSAGIYLYTVFSFMIMFLYRYNVTCKTSVMSSVFSRRNITTFMITAGVFCVIQAVLFYYSAVDSTFLSEKLNRTEDIEAVLYRETSQSMQMQKQNEQQLQQQQQSQGQEHPQQQQGFNNENAIPRSVGIFGADYARNPMVFLSGGIFAISNVISSIVILLASLVVACKLRGRQDSMSEQSQSEHQKLTNVLILDAYIPVLMAVVPAVNFVLMIFKHDSLRVQEFLGVLVLAPIPVLFPIMNVFLVPQLRSTALQVVICTYWRNKEAAENQDKKDKANSGNDALNQNQLDALKSMTTRAGMNAEERAADDKSRNGK